MSNFNRFHAGTAKNDNNYDFERGTPRWCLRSRGTPSHRGMKFGIEKLEVQRYHSVKTGIVYLISAPLGTGT
jgi:hypothetical protein